MEIAPKGILDSGAWGPRESGWTCPWLWEEGRGRVDPSPLWPKAAKQRLIGRRLRVNGFLASGPGLRPQPPMGASSLAKLGKQAGKAGATLLTLGPSPCLYSRFKPAAEDTEPPLSNQLPAPSDLRVPLTK